MKKTALLSALSLCLTWGVQAQRSTLTMRHPGFDHVLVHALVDGQLRPADTLRPDSKGRFRLESQDKGPAFWVMTFPLSQSNNVQLMLLPGERVELQLDTLPGTHFVRVAKAKGSENMELFSQFQTIISTPANTDEEIASLQRRMSELLERHSHCLMAAFLVTIYEQDEQSFLSHYDLIAQVRDALKPAYGGHPFVQHLDQKLAATLGPGRMAPDIDMLDTQDKHRRLSDLRGQVVLLDFWASWCRPCRAENPNVVRLYKKYHGSGFEVFSVSLDKERAAWLQAIERDGLEWPNHVSDLEGWTSSGGATYGITSIPATVLIDREGRILARNLRGAELEHKLKEIFGF